MDKIIKDGADAFYTGTTHTCKFIEEFILPRLQGQLNITRREGVILNLYYRIFLYAEAASILNKVRSFQSVASAARSIFELTIDLKLITSNKIKDAVEKYYTFTIIEKSRAAEIAVDIKSSQIIDSEIQSRYLKGEGSKSNVEALKIKYWGTDKNNKPKRIKHWSGVDLENRVNLLGQNEQEFYKETYPNLSWYLHSASGAGFINFNADGYMAVYGHSQRLIHLLLLEATLIIGKEFHLDKAEANFKTWLKRLDAVPGMELLKKDFPDMDLKKFMDEIK